jgi:hypothetical protein
MWQKLSPGLATWQDTKIDPNSWCYSGLLGCFTAHMLLLLLLKRLCRLRMQASIIIISCQINPARVSHASTPAYKASPSTLSYSQIGSGPLEVLNSACPQHSTRHDVVPRHRVSDFGHTRMVDNVPLHPPLLQRTNCGSFATTVKPRKPRFTCTRSPRIALVLLPNANARS